MQSSWQKTGVGDFKYHVGISSLTQVASREDRVCVLNILGGESSEVIQYAKKADAWMKGGGREQIAARLGIAPQRVA